MDIIRFDESLIGIPFENGYRISFDIKNDVLPDFDSLLEYLVSSFGPIIEDSESCYDGISWSLSEYKLPAYANFKRLRLTIVVNTYSQLEALCGFYEWPLLIDDSHTKEGKLRDLIEPFLFEPLRPKRLAYLRQKIAEIFHGAWYQVQYDYTRCTFHFKQYTIGI